MINFEQGGAIANSAGKTLESAVRGTLTGKGLEILNYKDWVKDKSKHSDELLICNAPYRSVYGHNAKTEFLILSKRYQVETRVECKWQSAKGSVDEKFPYLFINLTQQINERHIIILLDGGGAKEGAISWLAKACSEFNNEQKVEGQRTIELMNLGEFILWVNNTFKISNIMK